MHPLRRYIRTLIEKELKVKGKDLLIEPDEVEGREEQEVSSGGVAGVSVPLGAGPNYPGRPRRPRKKK
jgi:hypothetical protein